MTKFVKCVDNVEIEDCVTLSKEYEVFDEYDTANTYKIINDKGRMEWYLRYRFKVIEEEKETKTYKFIPDSEVKYAIVDGVKGILIEV